MVKSLENELQKLTKEEIEKLNDSYSLMQLNLY
jgi:hypothetical protein